MVPLRYEEINDYVHNKQYLKCNLKPPQECKLDVCSLLRADGTAEWERERNLEDSLEHHYQEYDGPASEEVAVGVDDEPLVTKFA